jgi:hypothetical protein
MDNRNSQEEISRLIDQLIQQTVDHEYQQEMHQQEQETRQQPSIQEQMQAQDVPNRWYTPVSVKCQTGPVNQIAHHYRYFTDIQMAYIWIKEQTRRNDSNWTLATFFETCDAMDSQWQSTQTSEFLVAHSGTTLYIIEYEPAMTFESVMAINNPNANTQYQSVQY